MSFETNIPALCKYCETPVQCITAESLTCTDCEKYVHIKCLKRECVPGGLAGDVFFTFVCAECSDTESETFSRDKITWLQAIAISLYHLRNKSPGLARKGYFHWKIHIVAFIDKYWDILFRKDFKRKKKWMGAISGSLSNFSPHFFRSGTTLFNELGWWTLSNPKLTPNAVYQINAKLMLLKQKAREENRMIANDVENVHQICLDLKYLTEEELQDSLQNFNSAEKDTHEEVKRIVVRNANKDKMSLGKHTLLPTLENFGDLPKKMLKLKEATTNNLFLPDTAYAMKQRNENYNSPESTSVKTKFLDPFCHYNTSLKNLLQIKGETLKVKLLGGIREDLILSPYTGIYLKPFIRRDITAFPMWLRLLAELQITANKDDSDYILPPRAPINYTYVQPQHIPAINSLCNQFFWPGIDLTECLQYPDYSCVVLYKKLIVAFAFLVPDVKVSENYLSFIFTRPNWRNCGIGRFMIYHLIQTSLGKDITLHVSINNPALFLYQKFGFKVEHVALDFYDKYIRSDTKESKHAFFCRLER